MDLPTHRYRRGRLAATIAVGYLGLVAAVTVFVAISTQSQDGSLAGVWLLLVTLPISLLLQFIPMAAVPALVVFFCGGLLQSWLLWLILRGKPIR